MRIDRKKELTAVVPNSVISRSGGGTGGERAEMSLLPTAGN
jgi:hypothetical protein